MAGDVELCLEDEVEVPEPELGLPIDEHRERILQHIRENRVTHIQGETGCGKSTRLPQFILEDGAKRGEHLKIVVTQPRRMAAITLAQRVANVIGVELGEGTVGYRISGDSIDGRLCFVTVGYLLQRLVNNPKDFSGYTHVILDEVHERGVDADLLSMLIKLLMHCFPTVKLIVMSATLQATLFANYFASISPGRQPPSVLKVGARVFPVEQIFLDDLKTMFDFSEGRAARALESALQVFNGLEIEKQKGTGKGKEPDPGGEAEGFLRVLPRICEGLLDVTAVLVQQLAKPGCTVLVFLPGIADITSLFEVLAPYDDSRQSGHNGVSRGPGGPRLRVYALHSMIPRTEQEDVFLPPAKDTCHIILASNIAESSLTLPSVCAVVDLGLRRTVQYDTRRLMSVLMTTWCSQSSCKQRRGRAGRTMPGRAICLVPRKFFDENMPAFDPPEMLSAPLTKLYLQAKQLCTTLKGVQESVELPPDVRMDVSHPKDLLNEVVQPPAIELLEAAVRELAAVGCLTAPTEDAEVTPLGRLATALPCDLRLCRLIYLGLLFQCPEDAIAMAAGLTASDPFTAPSLLVLKDQRQYVEKLSSSFASRRKYDNGSFSEPIMMHTLFVEWIRAGAPRGAKALQGFLRSQALVPKKFESLTNDAVDLTVRVLKVLKPGGYSRNQIEELLSAMHYSVDRRQEPSRVGRGAKQQLFRSDLDKLRALLALAFSDQMLFHLQPNWAPSNGGKKKQEEQIYKQMEKLKLEPANTVALIAPPDTDKVQMSSLCTTMVGEMPTRVLLDREGKYCYVSFRPTMDDMKISGDKALLRDVPAVIHRLNMFGSGRFRFNVDTASYRWPVELFKPIQPFLLQWEVLTDDRAEKKKKKSKVQGVCDWRSPLGFVCHVDDTLPPAEFLGCCASIEGSESGAQAYLAGASVLPLTFLPVFLATLCPERWEISWALDAASKEIWGVKILQHEILALPPHTLGPRVIEAVNRLRTALRNALAPKSWFQEPGEHDIARQHQMPGGRREREESDLLDLPNLTSELRQLLEVLPAGGTPQLPKKLKWAPAVSKQKDKLSDKGLRPLQLLADQKEAALKAKNAPPSTASAPSSSGGTPDFQGLVEYLAQHGECELSTFAEFFKMNKKKLATRPDLVTLRLAGAKCYVRLAKDDGTGAAAATRPEVKARSPAALFEELVQHLAKNGECEMSTFPPELSMKKKKLEARPDLFIVRTAGDRTYVSLAKGAASTSSQGVSSGQKKANRFASPGITHAELVDEITRSWSAGVSPPKYQRLSQYSPPTASSSSWEED